MATIDPGEVISTFKGVDLDGVADGTYIEAERAEDGWSMHAGAQGTITRIRNRNTSGAVTVTLGQATITNARLMAIALADEATGSGIGSLLITDLNGTTRVRATKAWIRKIPKMERAKEHANVVWVFDCEKLEIFVGGSNG